MYKTIKYKFFVVNWGYLKDVINYIIIKNKFYVKIKYW